jgi:hypothetical protein
MDVDNNVNNDVGRTLITPTSDVATHDVSLQQPIMRRYKWPQWLVM